jgi:hypothetical protein
MYKLVRKKLRFKNCSCQQLLKTTEYSVFIFIKPILCYSNLQYVQGNHFTLLQSC